MATPRHEHILLLFFITVQVAPRITRTRATKIRKNLQEKSDKVNARIRLFDELQTKRGNLINGSGLDWINNDAMLSAC